MATLGFFCNIILNFMEGRLRERKAKEQLSPNPKARAVLNEAEQRGGKRLDHYLMRCSLCVILYHCAIKLLPIAPGAV